jgi:protein-L-isoaspartate(D-aspartate) O-methyltransferase
MDRATELDIVRRAFAKHVLAEVQVDNPRLEAAFAAVHREDFLGPGPWVIPRWLRGWVATPDDDPVHLYIDNVVQIIAERHLNNGQPSGHAKWIDSAGIEPGDHVVHVGIGTGYYTAILAHLVGPSGRVTAIEVDLRRARRRTSRHSPTRGCCRAMARPCRSTPPMPSTSTPVSHGRPTPGSTGWRRAGGSSCR